jgi:hypothetical protein
MDSSNAPTYDLDMPQFSSRGKPTIYDLDTQTSTRRKAALMAQMRSQNQIMNGDASKTDISRY